MRLIDLDKLNFIDKNKNEVQIIHTNLKLDIAHKSYKEGYEEVEQLCKNLIQQISNEYVYFELIINDPSFKNIERTGFAIFIGNIIASLLTTNEQRDREPRLNIPKHLDTIRQVSRINILKAINYKTIVKGFGGRIEINSKKFYLLGS